MHPGGSILGVFASGDLRHFCFRAACFHHVARRVFGVCQAIVHFRGRTTVERCVRHLAKMVRSREGVRSFLWRLFYLFELSARSVPCPQLFQYAFLSRNGRFIRDLRAIGGRQRFVLFQRFRLFFGRDCLGLRQDDDRLVRSNLARNRRLFFYGLFPGAFRSALHVGLHRVPEIGANEVRVSFTRDVYHRLAIGGHLPNEGQFYFVNVGVRGVVYVPFRFPRFKIWNAKS